MKFYYYVCDRCGDLSHRMGEPIEDESGWECVQCGSNAVWEFTDKRNAEQHSRHIQAPIKSGLFRSAGPLTKERDE